MVWCNSVPWNVTRNSTCFVRQDSSGCLQILFYSKKKSKAKKDKNHCPRVGFRPKSKCIGFLLLYMNSDFFSPAWDSPWQSSVLRPWSLSPFSSPAAAPPSAASWEVPRTSRPLPPASSSSSGSSTSWSPPSRPTKSSSPVSKRTTPTSRTRAWTTERIITIEQRTMMIFVAKIYFLLYWFFI